jgi:hypothetical protein
MKVSWDGKQVPDIERVTTPDKILHFINGIPSAHHAYAETYLRLEALQDMRNAEEALVEVMRSAAMSNPDLKANSHILTRRLSDKFRPVWHDPPGNSPTPDPSAWICYGQG